MFNNTILELINEAVAEKISALRSARLFAGLRETIGREELEAALSQVPDGETDPWDVWTERHDL